MQPMPPPPASNPTSFSASLSERRTQFRLRAQVPIKLRCYGEAQARTVILVDLSWGGALCQASNALPASNKPLWLLLPWKSGETIQIEAMLLRQRALDDGRHLIAVRFSRLSLLNQARLEKLLGLMQARDPEGKSLNVQALVATLEILIQTLDEWRWALADIAKGLLRINTTTAHAPGQSLGIQFNGVPTRARLRLRARVLASEAMPMRGVETAPLYLLTLEFEHPLAVLRGWAEWLIGQIPVTEIPRSLTDHPQTPTLPGLGQGRLVLDQGERSALEIGFPEALDYLVTAWGDISTFELVFRQLVLGDCGDIGTWTPEAWEELQFLQDVHDEAYGVSETRHNPLKAGRAVR
jgi:hypothetical protein